MLSIPIQNGTISSIKLPLPYKADGYPMLRARKK